MLRYLTNRQAVSGWIVACLVAALLVPLPNELADAAQNRRGNRNRRNQQQQRARAQQQAKARAKQELAKVNARLVVVNAGLADSTQRLTSAESQRQAVQATVTDTRQQYDSAAAEANDARAEVTEIETQLEESESPASRVLQAKTAYKTAKIDYTKTRKVADAKLDKKISLVERDEIVSSDLEVKLKKSILRQSETDYLARCQELYQKSPDWRNAQEILKETSSEAGTTKRTLDKQISGYNTVRHVVLVTRRQVAAWAQEKQVLEIKKKSLQKIAGGGKPSKSRSGR